MIVPSMRDSLLQVGLSASINSTQSVLALFCNTAS
ncbi:unnamed protein product [Brassica oleracea]